LIHHKPQRVRHVPFSFSLTEVLGGFFDMLHTTNNHSHHLVCKYHLSTPPNNPHLTRSYHLRNQCPQTLPLASAQINNAAATRMQRERERESRNGTKEATESKRNDTPLPTIKCQSDPGPAILGLSPLPLPACITNTAACDQPVPRYCRSTSRSVGVHACS
jgi:hypothetical protein